MLEHLVHTSGWTATFVDPSLHAEIWDLKEDLLQLHHGRLNRLADLGWYGDRFRAVVFQDGFLGQLLGQGEAFDQANALAALQQLLDTFAVE
jgi:hypothetical protein